MTRHRRHLPRPDRALRGRAQSMQDWLQRRADTPIGRLAFQWFRAYFAASRNSGCAVSLYCSLSVLPAALVALAVAHPSESSANIFAERLITHMRLSDTTASLVEGTFGSTSANALAASLSVAVSFLIWGIGIGQIYQDVYARAWGIKVGSLADQGLFAGFFFLLAGVVALIVYSGVVFSDTTWYILLPVWIVVSTGWWLLVPSLLLHRSVGVRRLLPGALVASVVVGGTIATAPLWLSPTLNANAKAFGAFGVVLTLVAYLFILITISLVCGVFSPVWAAWRESERDRRTSVAAPAVTS
jgi:hypothetical protein